MGTNCKLRSDRGVEQLLYDMELLLHESQSADTVFFIGIKEVPIPAHSFLLKQRCRNYRNDLTRFPTASPEIFQLFLTYVYTGKLRVDSAHLLDLLSLANEFGLDDLEKTCEELMYTYVESSPIKAAQLLTNVLGKKKKLNGSSSSSSGGGGGCTAAVGTGGRNSSVPSYNSLQSIITHCTRLIGENPGELFQSNKFLSMPTETLVTIISSDQLCLEEEQIWRYVLKWAQFNAGVPTPLPKWSEDDRLKVAKYLTPVISHVRLLLIDSRIFAEEVEPTGCVPMALSLERYRFAALSQQQFLANNNNPTANNNNNGHNMLPPSLIGGGGGGGAAGGIENGHGHGGGCGGTATLTKLTPRNSPKLFQSSVIVQRSTLMSKLNEWYSEYLAKTSESLGQENIPETAASAAESSCKKYSWKCVFRGSLHGFSAEAFHKYCDGVKPTYVLVAVDSKHICGGFTDLPWKSLKNPKYESSSNTFLFSYNNEDDAPGAAARDNEPTRFKVVKKHFAICQYSDSGPVFGAGADLYISSNCDLNDESYSNIGHSYEIAGADRPSSTNGGCGGGAGASSVLTPNYNFNVSDYEVFVPVEQHITE